MNDIQWSQNLAFMRKLATVPFDNLKERNDIRGIHADWLEEEGFHEQAKSVRAEATRMQKLRNSATSNS